MNMRRAAAVLAAVFVGDISGRAGQPSDTQFGYLKGRNIFLGQFGFAVSGMQGDLLFKSSLSRGRKNYV